MAVRSLNKAKTTSRHPPENRQKIGKKSAENKSKQAQITPARRAGGGQSVHKSRPFKKKSRKKTTKKVGKTVYKSRQFQNKTQPKNKPKTIRNPPETK